MTPTLKLNVMKVFTIRINGTTLDVSDKCKKSVKKKMNSLIDRWHVLLMTSLETNKCRI